MTLFWNIIFKTFICCNHLHGRYENRCRKGPLSRVSGIFVIRDAWERVGYKTIQLLKPVSLCPSLGVSVWLSICLAVYLFVCPSVCPSVLTSIYLSVHITVRLFICTYLCLCMSVSLSDRLSVRLYDLYVYLYVRLFICPSICLYVYLSVSLFVSLSLYVPLSVRISVCLSARLSVRLSVCRSIYLYIYRTATTLCSPYAKTAKTPLNVMFFFSEQVAPVHYWWISGQLSCNHHVDNREVGNSALWLENHSAKRQQNTPMGNPSAHSVYIWYEGFTHWAKHQQTNNGYSPLIASIQSTVLIYSCWMGFVLWRKLSHSLVGCLIAR